MTHDYKRHGTTALFAALSVLDGAGISDCMNRHRHQEWFLFLKRIDRETPAGKQIHLIVDNYATHQHPKVQRWFQRHPRFSSPLHSHQRFLAQYGRTILSRSHGEPRPARGLPQRTGFDRCHPGLHRIPQPKSQTLLLGRQGLRYPGKGKTWQSRLE
jgi:hypothetical protein